MEMMDIPVETLLDPGENISGIDSKSPIPGIGSKSFHADEVYEDVLTGNVDEINFVKTIFEHYLTECIPECLPHINGEGVFISDGRPLEAGKENKSFSGGIYALSNTSVEKLVDKEIVSHINKVPAEKYSEMFQITQYIDKTKGSDGIYLVTKDDSGYNIVLNKALFFKEVDVEKYSPYSSSDVGVKTNTAIYAATQLGEHNMKTVVIKQTARDALGFGTMLVFNKDGLEMGVYLKYVPVGKQPPDTGYSVSPEDMAQNIAVVMNTYGRIDGQLTCNKTFELSLSEFYNAWGFDISKHCGAKNLPGKGRYSAQFTQPIPYPVADFRTPMLPSAAVYTIGSTAAAK